MQEWEGGVVTEIVDNVTMARHCRFPAHWSLPEIRERLWGGKRQLEQENMLEKT